MVENKEKVPEGFQCFIKNDWTEWAEIRGLNLNEQKLSVLPKRKLKKRESTSYSTRNMQLRIIRSGMHGDDEWLKWLVVNTDKLSPLTISEHKGLHFGARPEWAKTFSERSIGKKKVSIDKNKRCVIIEQGVYRKDIVRHFRSMEREIMKNSAGDTLLVERLLDYAGICRRATIIYRKEDGKRYIRGEYWVSKGKWEPLANILLDDNEELYSDINLFMTPLPWLHNTSEIYHSIFQQNNI